MGVRKRKEVEAWDGSYAGQVLGLFDEMEKAAVPDDSRVWLGTMGFAAAEERRLNEKMAAVEAGAFDERAAEFDALWRRRNKEAFDAALTPSNQQARP